MTRSISCNVYRREEDREDFVGTGEYTYTAQRESGAENNTLKQQHKQRNLNLHKVHKSVVIQSRNLRWLHSLLAIIHNNILFISAWLESRYFKAMSGAVPLFKLSKFSLGVARKFG